MRDYFYRLVDTLAGELPTGLQLHASLAGETSDFVRFNHNKVRQAGRVEQHGLDLALVDGSKQVSGDYELCGDETSDLDAGRTLVKGLLELLRNSPDDPYLNYNDRPQSTDDHQTAALPLVDQVTENIYRCADGLDLVGIYAAGDMMRGYANSYGQKNWHSRSIFNLDWSIHGDAGQAVKSHYAGQDWDPDTLALHISDQRQALDILKHQPKNLQPGQYRAYLAPTALAELLDLLSHDGFSLRELRTYQSPLLKLAAGSRHFDSRVSLYEDRQQGLEPVFSDEGFILPDRTTLVEHGGPGNSLVDARSAREYGADVNAAVEAAESLSMTAGSLADADILAALDTGLYINHLWYANFSDITNCRMTGLTRYACFWVERGQLQAPLAVMRFDDSLFRLLGDQLEAITQSRLFMHSADSYGARTLASMQLPGILCSAFNLTL